MSISRIFICLLIAIDEIYRYITNIIKLKKCIRK